MRAKKPRSGGAAGKSRTRRESPSPIRPDFPCESVLVCDAKGRISAADAAAGDLCGGDSVGRPFREAFPLVLRTGETGARKVGGAGRRRAFSLSPVLKGRRAEHVEAQMTRKDGRAVRLVVTATPLRVGGAAVSGCVVRLRREDAGGGPPGERAGHARQLLERLLAQRREYDVIQRELREETRARIRMEEQLRHTDNQLFGIFERAPVALCLLDSAGRFVLVNAALEKKFGFRREELRGRPYSGFLRPKGKGPDRELFDALTDGRLPLVDEEQQFVTRRGPIWARVRISPLPRMGDSPLLLGVLLDTTRQKAVETALRRGRRNQETLLDLHRLAMAGTDRAGLARESARAACVALGMSVAVVWETAPDGTVRPWGGFPERLARRIAAEPGTFAGYVADAGGPVVCGRLDADSRFRPPKGLPEDVVGGVGVPVPGTAGRPCGVLAVYGPRGVHPVVDVDFVEAVAHFLGAAAERKALEEELSEAEARFRILVERNPAVTYVRAAGTGGAFTYVSPRIGSVLGFTPEQLLADPGLFAARMHPDDRSGVEEQYAARVAGGKEFRAEYRMVAREGRIVWFLDEAVPVRGKRGRIAFYQGFLANITACKMAESALAETTELLEKVFSTTYVGIAYLARDFTYVRVNRAYARAAGRTPVFYAGKNYFALDADEGRMASFRDVLSTGKPFFARAQESGRREGGTRYLDWSLLPVLDKGGEVAGLVLSVLDVSERKWAEEDLRKSEQRFRSLVELLPVGISVVRDGKVVFRNGADEAISGPLADTAEFGRLLDVHPEDREAFASFRDRVGSPGEPGGEFRFLVPGRDEEGARTRWLMCRSAPIEHQGAPAALVCTLDVTRVKELEHLAAFRERLASLGQVSAGMAHEIRNPLSGINIYLSAVEQIVGTSRGLEPEERAKLEAVVEHLRSASAKISSVIQRIMEFAKPLPPTLDLVDVNEAVRGALRSTAVLLRKRRVRIRRSLSTALPRCRADSDLLEQVLVNLVTNAVQAMDGMGEARRLEVKSCERGDSVLIDVSDSGPGVPVHLRGRIFDPFYTTRKEGYGIGLSFSHRVITDHGGSLTVQSSRWGGGLFRIALPVAGADPAG